MNDQVLVCGFLFLGGVLLSSVGNLFGGANDWLLGFVLMLMGLIPLLIRWFSALYNLIRTLYRSTYEVEENEDETS